MPNRETVVAVQEGGELFSAIERELACVYDSEHLAHAMEGLRDLVERYRPRMRRIEEAPDASRVYLITYGDSFTDTRMPEAGLSTLKRFYDAHLSDMVSDVHILPMFPYSSDDGFSVVDYLRVREDLGTWREVDALGGSCRMMFDFVANHMSKEGSWFRSFLSGREGFEHAFIERDDAFDASRVTRPRTSPLFHRYEGESGSREVWTTFSEDQVDLNYADVTTFLRLTSVLLEYLAHGASSIRLDAIGFLWKESGTCCMSLPQTHAIVRVWRALAEHLAGRVQIITETNVPHEENISYLGDGSNEANMVYQFALPPLALHAFIAGDAEHLAAWARDIQAPSDTATYFNFLSSHDGVGLRPTEGILSDAERAALVERTRSVGGLVSMKSNPDGSESVYELNVNYLAALRAPGDDDASWLAKVGCAFSILLAMVGVPAFYVHMLVGSGNDIEAVERTGIARRINRAQLDLSELESELSDTLSVRAKVYELAHRLIRCRRVHAAFDPYGKQEVIDAGDSRLFALRRDAAGEQLVCCMNVAHDSVASKMPAGVDVLTGERVERDHVYRAYEVRWICPDELCCEEGDHE